MNHLQIKRLFTLSITVLMVFTGSLLPLQPTYASTVLPTSEAQIVVPAEGTANWPAAPTIESESAILIEVETGTILYGKNIHTEQYPASITKLLTTYIASSTCSLSEEVVMSSEAVYSIDWRSDANIGIHVGDAISLEEALYAVMVQSANEVAYAVAEHVSGTMEEFTVLMNETATELGCLNSNFVNPNGIHDEEHYTTAYDMAMIASAYFQNDFNCLLSSTSSYTIPQSDTQPSDSMYLSSKNKLFPGQTYAYEYLVGSKTGYTSDANQTLVSCAQKDGMTLVCVVLNVEQPYQFEDTVNLFQYGFSNFQTYSVLDNDTFYSVNNTDLFNTVSSDLGASKSLLSFDDTSYIVLPNQAAFADTTSYLAYGEDSVEGAVATAYYEYNGIPVGHASIYSTYVNDDSDLEYFHEDIDVAESTTTTTTTFVETLPDSSMIIINVKYVIGAILAIAIIVILLFVLKERIQSYSFTSFRPESTPYPKIKSNRRYRRSKRMRRRRPFILVRLWHSFLSLFNHYYD